MYYLHRSMINLKIPLSIFLIDNYTRLNCLLLIDIYLRNQYIFDGPYSIKSVELDITDNMIINATIEIPSEFKRNEFSVMVTQTYTPPAGLKLIHLQQNGIGFADPNNLKDFKKKQHRKY